jgi:hypothetical protein
MDDATRGVIMMIHQIGWEKFERIRQGKEPFPSFDVKPRVYATPIGGIEVIDDSERTHSSTEQA